MIQRTVSIAKEFKISKVFKSVELFTSLPRSEEKKLIELVMIDNLYGTDNGGYAVLIDNEVECSFSVYDIAIAHFNKSVSKSLSNFGI